jgi:endonuclease/exonuclease/phosphatase family metal-dependent hydrolase
LYAFSKESLKLGAKNKRFLKSFIWQVCVCAASTNLIWVRSSVEMRKSVKIVTFNIRCDYGQDGNNNFSFRKTMILEKILKEKPDIICFQEVLPHVAIWLKDNLNDYYIIGCGRDENLDNEQMSIAYNKLKFDLLEMETFWLSNTPHVPGSRYVNQSECPRVCTVGLFRDTETKEVFRIYNTHLDHIGSEARKLGLGQILETMKDKESFIKVPVILTGDFNALPESLEMELLKEYPNLLDVTSGLDGTFHDFGRLEELEKIDYIIVEDNFICTKVDVWKDCIDGIYLSDHYPVCAHVLRV